MADLAKILPVLLKPDSARTVIRPFEVEDPSEFAVPGRSRAQRIVERIMGLSASEVKAELQDMRQSLDERHPDVEPTLRRRFEELKGLTLDKATATPDQALLIGAYFSEEFSFESAALFNPSVVRHPDQSGVAPGDTRLVLSLRGIGEGHVSSLTFRTGVWAADGSISIDTPGPSATGPIVESEAMDNGERRVRLRCGGAREISETVIFPFLPSQGRGIEDVRLTEFTEDDGAVDYRGTFTAFSGEVVREVLLRTPDFREIEMRGVEGPYARAKGMALFPRRIGGRYFMLGRQDNENLWLMSSDDFYAWDGGAKLLGPEAPWEFMQIGNCGSPIEIEEGWLVLTHGVGSVRNYSVGACLLDRDDPSKVLGRLKLPLLEPQDQSRDGYVPNVIYSCGGMVRGRTLLLPYGVADNYCAFATVELDGLVAAMA
ncbi:glycoside hydrolase family 130 protein [soil metagenome]